MARVPTGAGRVEARRASAECARRRSAHALYNYDIDDATLKTEHRQWLEDNVLPLLAVAGVRVLLRGTASRTGSNAYNQKLSERRVAGVRDFLLGRGAAPGQVETSATGEEEAAAAGRLDGKENERDRAVVVEVVVPTSGRDVRFDRRVLTARDDGFDASETGQPPWVMVPFQPGTRDVRLVNGVGLTLVSTNPRVVRVEHPDRPGRALALAAANPQFLRLRQGGRPGEAEVRAVDACGTVHARLRVAVLRKLTVKAAFHYVVNRGVGTRTRNVGDEVALVAEMNRIYGPQANIEFVSLGARRLPISDRLGTEVTTDGRLGGDWNAIARHRNASAQFNVFFVREIERDAEGTTDTEGNTTDTTDAETVIGGDGDCIFEDSIGVEVGETLGHEAGHALGVRHADPVRSTRDMLMWDFTDERGRFIPRVHVERMRRNVRRP